MYAAAPGDSYVVRCGSGLQAENRGNAYRLHLGGECQAARRAVARPHPRVTTTAFSLYPGT